MKVPRQMATSGHHRLRAEWAEGFMMFSRGLNSLTGCVLPVSCDQSQEIFGRYRHGRGNRCRNSVPDALDLQLVYALQLDGRASFSLIGEVLGVSDQTIARRYHRLRSAGLLRV